MSLIRNHIKSLARAHTQKSVPSENSQIQELGHYDPIGYKYLRLLPLLEDNPLGRAILSSTLANN
jgi:hypothetical protein